MTEPFVKYAVVVHTENVTRYYGPFDSDGQAMWWAMKYLPDDTVYNVVSLVAPSQTSLAQY